MDGEEQDEEDFDSKDESSQAGEDRSYRRLKKVKKNLTKSDASPASNSQINEEMVLEKGSESPYIPKDDKAEEETFF